MVLQDWNHITQKYNYFPFPIFPSSLNSTCNWYFWSTLQAWCGPNWNGATMCVSMHAWFFQQEGLSPGRIKTNAQIQPSKDLTWICLGARHWYFSKPAHMILIAGTEHPLRWLAPETVMWAFSLLEGPASGKTESCRAEMRHLAFSPYICSRSLCWTLFPSPSLYWHTSLLCLISSDHSSVR